MNVLNKRDDIFGSAALILIFFSFVSPTVLKECDAKLVDIRQKEKNCRKIIERTGVHCEISQSQRNTDTSVGMLLAS